MCTYQQKSDEIPLEKDYKFNCRIVLPKAVCKNRASIPADRTRCPLAPSRGTKKRRRKPWKTSFPFPRPPQSEYASPLVHVRSDTKDCSYISRWFYSTGQIDKPTPAFSATSVTHQSPPRKCGQHLVVSLDAIDKVQCHNTANKTLCTPSSIIRRNRCRRRRFHIPWR